MLGAIAAHYVAATGYAAEVLADSPYGYWPLGDASGTTMTDASGNGRDGTYVNTPGLGSGGLMPSDTGRTSVDYNGSTHRSDVADDNGLDGLTALTVECIIRPDSITGLHGLICRDGNGTRQFIFDQSNATLRFVKLPGSVVTATSAAAAISVGTTYHVAAVYNGTDIRIYINGSLSGTPPAATGGLGTFARYLQIAHRADSVSSNPTNFYDGRMQEVAVYTTALSSTRIAAHYAASGL